MTDSTVPTAPHEWQGKANNLLGANLVGEVCGKKTVNQAYRWARSPQTSEAQNGPLAHVLLLATTLILNGHQIAAIDALRIHTHHLQGEGCPVVLSFDPPTVRHAAREIAHDLHAATCAMIDSAREGKPPVLIMALANEVIRSAQSFQMAYSREFLNTEGKPHFSADGPETTVQARVRKDRSIIRAALRAIARKLRG